MDFEIQFSDQTMLEANGSYEEVCNIMSRDIQQSGAVSVKGEWVIRSRLSMLSPFGFAVIVCSFYNNGKVYIVEYAPSTKDLHNTDIRYLTRWCNEFGWKTPEPTPAVVEAWLDFWKAEWDTHIVDSAYLDKRFGDRRDMQFDDNTNNEDEDEEIEDKE